MIQTDTSRIRISPISFIKTLIFLVKVEGESAWPDLIPGKRYFATKLLSPKPGDFIVFKNPNNKEEIFVKKILNLDKSSYFVSGNLPWSSSSSDFGRVSRKLVLGKVIR